MKTPLVIVSLIAVISLLIGYWIRGQMTPNYGFSSRAWISSHDYSQKLFINDIEEVNNLTEDWIRQNRDELDDFASIAVIPTGDNSVSIRWKALSDKQLESVSKVVHDHLDKAIETNYKKANKAQ